MEKIFSSYTQYQLLLFFLLKEKKDKIKALILPKYMEKIGERIGKKYKIILIEDDPGLKKIFQHIKYYINLKKIVRSLNINEEVILYGDSIINYIISEKNILYKIEDGLGNYNENLYLKEKETLKELLDKIIYFVIFKKKKLNEKEKILYRVKNFYCGNSFEKKMFFEEKIIRIDLKEYWKKKSEEEKEEILEIFGVEKELEIYDQDKYILLTQPLSEEKLVTEKEKIDIYKKVLEKYERNKIIIKPHPRETTDYKKFFGENYQVITGKYPIELLVLNGLNIKKVITLFSTSAFIFGKDVDFYGTKIHPKLYCLEDKHFKDRINCFL